MIGLVRRSCRSVQVPDPASADGKLFDSRPVMCEETVIIFIDRFAELESMVVLAMMVKNYKISVKQEPQFANETVEQTRARIFELTYGVTQTYVFNLTSCITKHQLFYSDLSVYLWSSLNAYK